LSPRPKPFDGFDFRMTLHKDMIQFLRNFLSVVDEQEQQLVQRVPGGKTSLWTMEMLYDRFGEMYLPTGWKKFEHAHQIKAKHFLVFNYDGECSMLVSSTNPLPLGRPL
jgi:hypothetical protein